MMEILIFTIDKIITLLLLRNFHSPYDRAAGETNVK